MTMSFIQLNYMSIPCVSIKSQCSFALSCVFDPSCCLNYFYPYNLKWNLI